MPEIKFNKSVVVFAAHPADCEIFAGGTLTLLAQKGYQITICGMSAGGMGGIGSNEKTTMRIRTREATQSAAMLSAQWVCLGGRDGYLYDTQALRVQANDVIRRSKAGIVLTHFPSDAHPDHRATAAIAEAAVMLATLPNVPCKEAPLELTPLFYHAAPSSTHDIFGNPYPAAHFYVNIAEAMDNKAAMLDCHRSQVELMKIMHKMDDFFGEMAKKDLCWGQIAGCDRAEPWWQHAGGIHQRMPLIQRELANAILNP